MADLKGKTAVVTGSTSGIGLAIARKMAGAGANVVINGFGEAAAIEKERAGIESDFKVKAAYSPADMTKPAEIAGMIALGEKTFGSVDVLVNNAGIQFVSPIEEFPIEKWDAIIAINLSSAFHGIRAAVPGMKKRKWGRIINTASAHSLVASPFKAAYVSAKHGIAGLTKTVALEVATFKITCNCISPGYVWTPLVEKQIPDTMKARNMTKEQVIHDVLLEAQPTKEFVTVGPGRSAGALSLRRRREPDHRRQPVDGWRLDGGVEAVIATRLRSSATPFRPLFELRRDKSSYAGHGPRPDRSVIASEAKQSSLRSRQARQSFVARYARSWIASRSSSQ